MKKLKLAATSIAVLTTFLPNTAHAKPGASFTDLGFKNKYASLIQIAANPQNIRSDFWQTNASHHFTQGEGPVWPNEVQTKNRYNYYYAVSTDDSNNGVESNFTAPKSRKLYGNRFDTDTLIREYADNLNYSDQNPLAAIRSIPAFEIPNDTESVVRWSPKTMKFGLRINKLKLSSALAILGEVRPKYTRYNRLTLKQWTVSSIDNRGIQIAARWDYERRERQYLTERFYTICTASGELSGFAKFKRGKDTGLDVELLPGSFPDKYFCSNRGALHLAAWIVKGSASFKDKLATNLGLTTLTMWNDIKAPLAPLWYETRANRLVFDSADYDNDGVWINFSINEAKIGEDTTLKLTLQSLCEISGKCPGSVNFSSGMNGVVPGEIKTTTTDQRKPENFSGPNNASPEQVTSDGVSENPSKNKAGELMPNTGN